MITWARTRGPIATLSPNRGPARLILARPQSMTATSPNAPTITLRGLQIAVEHGRGCVHRPCTRRSGRTPGRASPGSIHRKARSPSRRTEAVWTSSITSRSVRPRTSFIVKKIAPVGPTLPRSWIGITQGCSSWAVASASSLNRATRSTRCDQLLSKDLHRERSVHDAVPDPSDLAHAAHADVADVFVAGGALVFGLGRVAMGLGIRPRPTVDSSRSRSGSSSPA